MNQVILKDRLTPPSANHLLGTDNVGRDMLSRIIYGARISMYVGLGGTMLYLLISTVIGSFSGFLGGKFDLIVQRFVDGFNCFPDLPLLIMLMAVLGPGLLQILLVLGVNSGIQGTRGSRALIFMFKQNQYVDASRALGGRTWWIIQQHLFRNVSSLVIVGFTMGMGGVIMAEAGLSFLGLGLPDPFPSWGKMISGSGRAYMIRAPWMLFYPGLALAIAVFGINLFGDALRDLMDPRLRGGVGGSALGYNLEKARKARDKYLGKQVRKAPDSTEADAGS
jgi:peptide/nickel transport system permease protein